MESVTKLECWSEGTAVEIAKFIIQSGWQAKATGSAVLSDMPGQYAGCYCNALVKIAVPTHDDVRNMLGA